uniref:Uncharacterized protein n=1 Tax=Setaria viridis TaxID=4556 RepID=A0A4U6ULG6_SETVI|nr:hypothetical protein SEVIR_6G236300v2 [Setaria viridis]TKW11487.1 hypothetical protein SEVIR_6G236300v2 [Setaria viridis]
MRAAPEQGPIQVGTHLAACRKLTDKPSCRERDRARSRQAPGHACRVSLRFGATGRQSEIKVQTYDAVMRPVSFSLKSLQSRDMACAAVGGKSEFENKVDRSRIRSLTMFGKWRPFFIFDKMRFLRVLNLEGTLGLVNIMITKSILEGTSGLVNIGYVWLSSFGWQAAMQNNGTRNREIAFTDSNLLSRPKHKGVKINLSSSPIVPAPLLYLQFFGWYGKHDRFSFS